jgi:trehalose 6-phosphate synthase
MDQVHGNTKLVVVSNRGPVSFAEEAGRIVPRAGHGGLVTGLRDVVLRHRAVWISSAMTTADEVMSQSAGYGSFEHEVDGDTFVLKLVRSDPATYARYYERFSNAVLWPLQHGLFDPLNLPDTNGWWTNYGAYRTINSGFAAAVLGEIADSDEALVSIQDYHLYPLAELIRRHRPDVFTIHFVHIPWPSPDVWRMLPTGIRETLLGNMVANDIVGFHTRRWADNFAACCAELLPGAEVDREARVVRYGGRETWVGVYPLPISMDWWRQRAASEEAKQLTEELRVRREQQQLIVRIDRPDEAKNILRGLGAYDTFLRRNSDAYRGRVVFIVHLIPARLSMSDTREYLESIRARVAEIDALHGSPQWKPVELIIENSIARAAAEHRMADVFMCNSLMDGRNLVSLEMGYLNEVDGVLILSENAGAHELAGPFALSVNPWDVSAQAAAIKTALEMPADERARRSRGLKEAVTSEEPWFERQWADYQVKREQR